MEKKNLQILIGVAVIIAVLAVVFFVFTNKQMVTTTTENPVVTEPQSAQDIGGQDAGVSAVSISYAKALVQYADRRIQLDKNCQAYPNNVTYKDNTGIMIDNRSPQSRTVKVGTTFTIKPYGFKIVTLPGIYLKSKTLLVDCDGYQNVATVLVQE